MGAGGGPHPVFAAQAAGAAGASHYASHLEITQAKAAGFGAALCGPLGTFVDLAVVCKWRRWVCLSVAPGHRPPPQLRHLGSLGQDGGPSGVLGRVQCSHHPADYLQGVHLLDHLGRQHARRPEAAGARTAQSFCLAVIAWLLMQARHDAILVRLGQVCIWHCSFVLLLCSKGAIPALRQGCCTRAGPQGANGDRQG